MYKIRENDRYFKVRSRRSLGVFWLFLFLCLSIFSLYQGFEYVSVDCKRETSKGKRLKAKSPCVITHFDFKNGLTKDSIYLEEIIRMDKGYFAEVQNAQSTEIHYNPTFITKQRERYPLRRVSDVALTEDNLSAEFNNFIINRKPSVSVWGWYAGWWGVAAGISLAALVMLILTGRFYVFVFNKENHTFSFKSFDFLGYTFSEGSWKDISRIIYQKEDTSKRKAGIYFIIKEKEVAFAYHTSEKYKDLATQIAELIRPIAKPTKKPINDKTTSSVEEVV